MTNAVRSPLPTPARPGSGSKGLRVARGRRNLSPLSGLPWECGDPQGFGQTCQGGETTGAAGSFSPAAPVSANSQFAGITVVSVPATFSLRRGAGKRPAPERPPAATGRFEWDGL